MPDSADKEKARRDEAAFHLVSQWLIFGEGNFEKRKTLFSAMTSTSTGAEIRTRFDKIFTIVDTASAMGLINIKSGPGMLVFRYLGKMADIRDAEDFYILRVNGLISRIRIYLQMCTAGLAYWEGRLAGKTLEKSLEHSNVYVEDAKIPLVRKQDATDAKDVKGDEGD